MTIRHFARSFPVSYALLRTAALLAPRNERAEWLAEWRGELWQVRQSCNAASPGPLQANRKSIVFCLGAFRDALWLRRNDQEPRLRRPLRPGSALRCASTLAMWVVVSMVACVFLPSVRRTILPSPYRDAEDLVMISHGGTSSEHLPTVQFSNYRSWRSNAGNLFTELAFYQPIRKRIHISPHQTEELMLARASDNLFAMLNLPESVKVNGVTRPSSREGLILSEGASRRYFHGDGQIIGRIVEIAGKEMPVIGIVSENSWALPGRMDAWILEDEQNLDTLSPGSKGFVLGRVKPGGFPSDSSRTRSMIVFKDAGVTERYSCISLAQRTHEPFAIFLFTLLLALLALPATTPLPLGEYPVQRHRLPPAIRFRRWLFLAIKLSLILPLVYFSSLDLAYAGLPVDSPGAQYMQIISSFVGLLFALRWVLQDQRRRCPVCLRLLTNPARVGQAAQSFLAWNGTELMCSVGHGLLHIPELPTSWFSTQRWLYLDPSWSALFSESHLASAGIS